MGKAILCYVWERLGRARSKAQNSDGPWKGDKDAYLQCALG
jgi:hypothetical protein